MPDEDSCDAPEQWVLGRCQPGRPDLSLPGTMRVIRDLTSEQADELFAAAALYRRFGPDWAHNSVIRAGDKITQGILRSDPDAFDHQAVRWLIGQLVATALDRLDTSEATPATRSAIEDALGAAPTRTLEALVNTEWTLEVVPQADRHTLQIRFLSSSVDLSAWMEGLMTVLTGVSDAEVIEAEPDLVNAALAMASAHGEIGWGLVAIARRSDINGDGGPQINLQSLPFDLVDPTMDMVRIDRSTRQNGPTQPTRDGGRARGTEPGAAVRS